MDSIVRGAVAMQDPAHLLSKTMGGREVPFKSIWPIIRATLGGFDLNYFPTSK